MLFLVGLGVDVMDYTSGTFTTYYGRSQAIVRVGSAKSFTIKVKSGTTVIEKSIAL